MLLAHIGQRDSLIDLGCGLGLIDFALSPFIRNITCVDRDPAVIRCLSTTAAARGAARIEACCGDATAVRGCWGTVLTVFFDRTGDALHAFYPLCRDQMIAVVHASAPDAPDDAARHPSRRDAIPRMADSLGALGARYAFSEAALEFGQPFASRQEAAAFVRAYAKNPPDMSVDDYLDARLVHTGERRFPLYLPNQKAFGVFVIGRA